MCKAPNKSKITTFLRQCLTSASAKADGRVKKQVQHYNKYLKNSSFGVEKFNFSLGLLLIFNCTE